ncbi:MAG: 4-hydroxy-3-methylbut-2-enyl diphosphate reductase [Bacteroidales bacterium]|nr:4-hydroxy-3-methylbut-2-enyl diphosphate reductase [Bacteroidales bacterium]
MMKVEIDSKSGFCFGVVYAIQIAEEQLDKFGKLYCLGDIVHNNVEVERLKEKGLIIINHERFKNLKNCKVLIRAHGEPPETYKIALKNNIHLIDASCPVVLRLQKIIKIGFDEIIKKNGQLVIFGKNGHAEVNGLVGQTKGKAIVVSNISDINKIDFKKPIYLYSQTTKSLNEFYNLEKEIKIQLQKEKSVNKLITFDTICRQVSSRDSELRIFAQKHNVIIFVSGKKSSNGKMLYNVCKDVNEKSYFISDINEIDKNWFDISDSVGICGATSTPRWLMEKIAENIKEINILK